MKNFYRIKTERLVIRKIKPCRQDAKFISLLWKNKRVMKFVGFPNGIEEKEEKIIEKTKNRQKRGDEYHLIVELNGKAIGEALIGYNKESKIAETDVKIMPEFWGNGYGREIKSALVKWIFKNTDSKGVKATPNVKNKASIKMQESVGGKRIKKMHFSFPSDMKSFTKDLDCYVYIVYREDWEKKQKSKLVTGTLVRWLKTKSKKREKLRDCFK